MHLSGISQSLLEIRFPLFFLWNLSSKEYVMQGFPRVMLGNCFPTVSFGMFLCSLFAVKCWLHLQAYQIRSVFTQTIS